jgi:hypothetical protein
VRRDGKVRRQVRRVLAVADAAAALGPITPGCEVYLLTKGAFSLVDVLMHCLEATGPADVVVSTWTAAGADIGFAYDLLRSGAIRSLRFLVDFSFPSRQPAYCAALRERFGDDAIRVCKNHAKFCTIGNDTWNVVIRSSMNLNLNRRLENVEISEDRDLCEYLASVVDSLFEFQAAGEGFSKKPIEVCRDFERFGEVNGASAMDATDSTDTRKYFDFSPFGNDINRTGLTFLK